MNKLKILGPVELRGADGNLEHSFLAGPKRLALLAYLILNRPRGMQRRDRVLPLLWPEKGQKSARNSLSNLLYHIRTTLGRDMLITRGTEELGIDASRLHCDALIFEKLINEGKMKDAVELYRGDLLQGLHVHDAAPDFDQWIERERDRFRKQYGNALEALAEKTEKNGNLRDAVNWWTLRSQMTPYDTRVVKRLAEVITASGNRAEALRIAGEHAELLHQELDIDHQETMSVLTKELDKTSLKMKYPAADKYLSIKHLDFKSLAILPFEEIGKHEDTSNFASGLHNDLLIRLSGISSLNVISRTSVLHYQNTKKPVSEVAGEIGAGTILKGSIQFRSGRVRLNIQLIDVAKERQIWANTYDREFTAEQFFDIQSELALKITESLKARLSPDERKRVAEWAPTDDLEAHRLYTYGRRQLEQRTASGMKRAVEYFRNAVEQDSEFALAWVGFADALVLQYDYGHEVKEKTLPRAEKAIIRALELDPDLAEAYASLGLLHSNRHQGQAAILELKRAVELQPSYAEAHNWLSWNYQLLGRPVKALESAKKAVNLNPLSPEAVSNLSFSYLYNGYTKKALSEALRGIELQPDWGTLAFCRGLALFGLKRYSEAKLVLHKLSAPWAGNGPLATLALCHVMTGDKYEAEIIKEELNDKGDLFATGLVEASLGNKDRALELLQRIEYWDDWETLSVHHLYTTVFGPLKKDSRFNEILNNVHKSRGAEKETDHNVSVPDKKSIAVLPFIDYMKRDELSPFAKGIQNDLITKLSRVDGLTIISGDSTRRLRSEEDSIREIALKLGVGTVIKGGVQQMAGRLRLTIQLIDTQNEKIRWAETYDRELSTENLFNIQSEFAEKITGSLRAELTPFEKKRVEEKPTDNLNAYLLYTQGRTHLSQRTKQSIHKSLNLFRESVKEDPEYANAWAGIAEALLLVKWYNYTVDEELRDPMEAIQKALKLNPDLGETYCSLGIYHIYYQNGPEAMRALEKCIELQPGYSEAYNWLGWLRMIMDNPASGIQPAEYAARLDPLSPYTRVFLASVYLANKKYPEALKESVSARKIRPEYGLTHFMEGLSLYHLEKYPEAEFALQESLKQENGNSSLIRNESLTTLALVRAAKGFNPEDRSLLVKIKNSEDCFCAGLVEAAMNNYDKAYQLFEKVNRFGSFSTPMCRYYFPEVMGPIRKDSRFRSLKRKIDKSWGM